MALEVPARHSNTPSVNVDVMEIVPAVDIQNGDSVQLIQGDKERLRTSNAEEVVGKVASKGFKRIHLVDLDRAFSKGNNLPLIKSILSSLPDTRFQIGGGIRELDDIEEMLEAGAHKVISGTKAIEDPGWLTEAAANFQQNLMVSVDFKNQEVVTNGWRVSSGISTYDMSQTVLEQGVKSVLCTDVDRDGTLSGPNLEQSAKLGEIYQDTDCGLLLSGGIDTSHIEELGSIRGIGGVVVGTAFHINAVNV